MADKQDKIAEGVQPFLEAGETVKLGAGKVSAVKAFAGAFAATPKTPA